MHAIAFRLVPGEWAIARLPAAAPLPDWALLPGAFVALVRTAEELSIVAPAASTPADLPSVETGWSLLQLQGPFAFSETGILASFASPLAEAGIALFAVSTFNTDYLLLKTATLPAALRALAAAGHQFET